MTNILRSPESTPSALRQAGELAAATADRVLAAMRNHRQELLLLGMTLAFVVVVSILAFVALTG